MIVLERESDVVLVPVQQSSGSEDVLLLLLAEVEQTSLRLCVCAFDYTKHVCFTFKSVEIMCVDNYHIRVHQG